ncbi:MAG: Uma2 family endonuclease [Actinomycetota bacterium]
MAVEPQRGLTYEDLLEMFPDVDNVRRELIDGELIVSPPPATRHQRVVGDLLVELTLYAREHGGQAFTAPTGVFLSETNFVEPDVLFVTADHLERIEAPFVRGAPDIVVEVSSPSTRRLEIVRKRELYERFGVPEYWYVDLDADRVEIYRLQVDQYGRPELLERGDVLVTELLPGFRLALDDLL